MKIRIIFLSPIVFMKNSTKNNKLSFIKILDGKQITEEVRTPVRLKPKKDYQWVGKPVTRKDLDLMVRARELYVQDLRFPGMVHGRIVRPPGYKSDLLDYDEKALRNSIPGILKFVVNGSFMGVITEKEHQAENARLYLKNNTQWGEPEKLPEVSDLKEYIKNLPSEQVGVEDRENIHFTGTSIRASYSKPYVMHGAVGPSCAVGYYDNNQLRIWSHTQGVYPLRESLKELVDLPEENIRITGVPGSGCYGHNGADGVAADVALLAMAYPGRHVRLQWSRADEHGWEPYSSAMIMELEAELDGSGKISQWQYNLWSDTHSTRPGGNPGNLLASRYIKDPSMLESRGYLGGG